MSVKYIEISCQKPFAKGMSFGPVGPYEYIVGKVHFEIDPNHPKNLAVTDIGLAPTNRNGHVEFSSDFAVLRPQDPNNGRGSVLLDVVNRGRKTVLKSFNSVADSDDISAPLNAGNGFLMSHGYTVVFCGWQSDVPASEHLLGLDGPEAYKGGRKLTGNVLNQYQSNEMVSMFPLADREHDTLDAVDIYQEHAQMTVRMHPNDPPIKIPREGWDLINLDDEEEGGPPNKVIIHDGFEPGKIYQLVYTAEGSRVVGLGFIAVRDLSSFLKYARGEDGNFLEGSVERVHAFGSSQTGRFLRQYIGTGINIDEQGRQAVDGIIAHVGGGMRGEFNLRFGQPSKDVCYIIPELFPFTSLPQTDPLTGKTMGLLDTVRGQGMVPKIMFTNSSAEYWRGDAALIHTDLEDLGDAVEEPNVRIYHFAGTQHGTGSFPPNSVRADGVKGNLPFNAVDYTPLLRAALSNLDNWIRDGSAPPESKHPNFSECSAVDSLSLLTRFKEVPGVRVPSKVLNAMMLDYGSDLTKGRTTKLPPVEGKTYPALVSDVDETLNEISGIRLPDIAVPVSTNTGWNPRHEDIGNKELFIGITGGLAGWSLPLPVTEKDKIKFEDPRPSIQSLYPTKGDYMERVVCEIDRLIEEKYVLPEDKEMIKNQAEFRYDYVAKCGVDER